MDAGSLARACRESNEGQRLLEFEAGEIGLADLLGRTQVDTDVESIAGYFTYRRVLVTGAGGSIGSELRRHISRLAPRRVHHARPG